jgi:hypothetical protein
MRTAKPVKMAAIALTSPQQAASCHCTAVVPMPHLSPLTLTHSEQKAILRATACNPRDHLISSLALGTGLRLAEIVGLQVGDVYTPEGRPGNRLRILPEIAEGDRMDDISMPDALMGKLRRFWAHQATRREGLQPQDLFLAQRFARHVSPLTTTIYTHPSDQEMWERVRGLTC